MPRKPAPRPSRAVSIPPVAALAATLVAVAIVYARSFESGFVLDSRALILLNPSVQAATWDNVRSLLTQDYWYPFGAAGLYRPATTLSFLVNHALLGNGARPFGYHAVNLALHLANTTLVYLLCERAMGRAWPALVAAALFGLHPVATEAVTYIAGRADLLAAFGTLAALVLHARGDATPLSLAAIGASTAIAVLGKESAFVLPIAMLAHDAILGSRPRTPARYVVVAPIALACMAARIVLAGTDLPTAITPALDNPLVETGVLASRLTAIGVAARALALFLWPAWLSTDYSCCEIRVVTWPPSPGDAVRVGLVVAGALGSLAALVHQRRSHPDRAFFAALAVLTWLPASNLVVTIGTIFAERTLYLPLVGIAAVAASLLDDARSRVRTGPRGAITALVLFALVALAARARARNEDWKSDRTLWESALRAVPGSAKAHAGLAAELFTTNGAGIDEIVALGERAIVIRPDYQNALVALGGHHVAKAQHLSAAGAANGAAAAYARAIEVLERARELDDGPAARRQRTARPTSVRDVASAAGDPNLYNNLSLAYVGAGRLDEALAAYERSRDIDPLDARRHADVAAMSNRMGRWEEAAIELFIATALAPNDAELREWLIGLYGQHGGERPAAKVGPRGGELDLEHEIVRRHRCAALTRAAALLDRAGRRAEAGRIEADRERTCAGNPDERPAAKASR